MLIFGQPFNYKYGGGITLSNLFKGWSEDKIAVAATGHVMFGVTTDVCKHYYQLGEKEFKWKFPFNILQRRFQSGAISFDNKVEVNSKRKRKGVRYTLVNKAFYPILKFLGLFHWLATIRMSPEFKEWLSDFKPDVLYLQVSTRDQVLFASRLLEYLRIPSIIHMMDDWPSTISSKGLFRKYWYKKIDTELRSLLLKMDLRLSISEQMSAEYFTRYGIRFKHFHNPIDAAKYHIPDTAELKIGEHVRILYIGRIGIANKTTVGHFADSVSRMQIANKRIEFDIFTSDYDTPEAIRFNRLKSVRVHPAINHSAVPELLAKYDILLLPLDFTSEGMKYARYSIPTKASEYMASGIPILVYAPEQTAISQFMANHDCGFCLTTIDTIKLKSALELLSNDDDYRIRLSRNAVRVAFEQFDADKVRKEFQGSIFKLLKPYSDSTQIMSSSLGR